MEVIPLLDLLLCVYFFKTKLLIKKNFTKHTFNFFTLIPSLTIDTHSVFFFENEEY